MSTMDSKIQEALDKLRDAASHYEDVREGPALNAGQHAADDMRDAARNLEDLIETGGVIANVSVFVFTYFDGTTERMIYMAEEGHLKATQRAVASAMVSEADHGHVTYWAHAPGTVTW